MKRTLYFAYGSNLDGAQMRRRCPTSAPAGPATLDGWRLAFGGHSRTWGGPVATLVKDPDEWVDGLLYALLCTGTTLALPFAYAYDLVLLVPARCST